MFYESNLGWDLCSHRHSRWTDVECGVLLQVTGGSLKESREALELADTDGELLPLKEACNKNL